MDHMITVDVVLEVEPLENFTAWPISELSGLRYLALWGEMPPEEVGTAIAVIFNYNGVAFDEDAVLDGGLLDRHLAEAEALNAPGGLRLRDTATGAEFLPGCCFGLERWRDWYDVVEGREVVLGHSPDPRLEHREGVVSLWQDAASANPTLSLSSERLAELLAASERDLQAFLGAVRTWAQATIPDLATSLVAALDEHLLITPLNPDQSLSTRFSPAEATNVFAELLQKADRNPEDLTADSAWHHYLEFTQVPFHTPHAPDADMLLYQYGVHPFSGEPRFHLSLTRQFVMDRPEHLWQFTCDLQFAVSDALLALGTETEWWDPAAGPSLTTWAKTRRTGPEWLALADLKPLTVEIGCRPA
jgi:hypothetical protein